MKGNSVGMGGDSLSILRAFLHVDICVIIIGFNYFVIETVKL